jgi:glyoxylase-like metal-dependent hydrolase (beta-lactamase superfamily II)
VATTRREFLASSSIALLGAVPATRALFAQAPAAPAPPQTAFATVRGTVGTFIGQGGTIGWHIAPDGLVVVDAQMPATAKICLDGVTQRSAGRRIDCLVNTHHHWDHTAGNGVFKDAVAKILAHANVPGLQKAAAATQAPQPGMPGPNDQVYATATYTNTWREDVGKEVLALKHYGPAHTGGDSVVTFEKANVAHMGDLVFNRRHPFIDRPGGASIAGWITVLEHTIKDHGADTIYVFGHAGPKFPVTGSRADLAYMRDYLTALTDYVGTAMKAGTSRDVIIKRTDVLKGFEDHGPLIERVLTAAYDELAGVTPGAAGSSIAGRWNAVAFYDSQVPFTLDLKLEGTKVVGTIATMEGNADLRGATWESDTLTFETTYMNAPVVMKASLKDGVLAGTWSYNGGEATGRWEAKR